MCSPNRRRGSENYSSSRSHLSLAKAAPARRPDIPQTDNCPQGGGVGGWGGCVRPPARLSTSTQHPHARTHKTPPVRGAHTRPQRASMSRNDTWHSRVRGSAPAQQPSGVPESAGSAGDREWGQGQGSSDPSGTEPAAARGDYVRRSRGSATAA